MTDKSKSQQQALSFSQDKIREIEKMVQESWGFLAYQIYAEAVEYVNFQGNPIPGFMELPEKIHAAWIKVALGLYQFATGRDLLTDQVRTPAKEALHYFVVEYRDVNNHTLVEAFSVKTKPPQSQADLDAIVKKYFGVRLIFTPVVIFYSAFSNL